LYNIVYDVLFDDKLRRMTNNKIHKKLDQLYENPKSRNFINHLVRSYLPIDKVKVIGKIPKDGFRCSLTKSKLITKTEVMDGIRAKELDEELLDGMRSLFNEDTQADNPMRKAINGRQLGVTGKDTNTYMTYRAFQEFFSWVVKRMLEGDKHINWLINKINRDSLLDRAENLADSVETITVVDKMKNNGRAMTSLGDFEALQKLKEQMDGGKEETG